MPDITMILEYLHNPFGRFNRHIQAERFAEFFGFKNRFTFAGADVAAQKIRAVHGTELFFEIANQTLCEDLDLFRGVSRQISTE